MEGYKTLFTCNAGIALLDMGVRFGAWDETWQDEPEDNKYVFKIYVPEADIEWLDEEGTCDITNTANVIVEGAEE